MLNFNKIRKDQHLKNAQSSTLAQVQEPIDDFLDVTWQFFDETYVQESIAKAFADNEYDTYEDRHSRVAYIVTFYLPKDVTQDILDFKQAVKTAVNDRKTNKLFDAIFDRCLKQRILDQMPVFSDMKAINLKIEKTAYRFITVAFEEK